MSHHLNGLVAETDGGWQYAAWIAVDLKLLLFIVLMATLISVGVSVILVRGRRFMDHAAVFMIAFALLLTAGVIIFNGIAHHPVFVVEAFFPIP